MNDNNNLNSDEFPKNIIINKNKLVLISKLIKDLKHEYINIADKELIRYKLNIQRKLIERLFNDDSINKMIDNLNNQINKAKIKNQLINNNDIDLEDNLYCDDDSIFT